MVVMDIRMPVMSGVEATRLIPLPRVKALVFSAHDDLQYGFSLLQMGASGVEEIDELSQAFAHMTEQICNHRASLRHSAGSISQSQEEERQRVVRELHDDTIQNLAAILRGIELHQAMETDPERQTSLRALQAMVEQTLQGVRQLTRALCMVADANRAEPDLAIDFHLQGTPGMAFSHGSKPGRSQLQWVVVARSRSRVQLSGQRTWRKRHGE